jgi:large subunit ribosomal protein L4
MVQLALRSALSDRAADGKVVVVDGWDFPSPRTKDATAAMRALGLDGKVVLVAGRDEAAMHKSFRNLPDAHVLLVEELNAYDVLCSDWIVFTQATLPAGKPAEQAPAAASPDEPDATDATDEEDTP